MHLKRLCGTAAADLLQLQRCYCCSCMHGSQLNCSCHWPLQPLAEATKTTALLVGGRHGPVQRALQRDRDGALTINTARLLSVKAKRSGLLLLRLLLALPCSTSSRTKERSKAETSLEDTKAAALLSLPLVLDCVLL